jgi:hypothetical protein
MPSLAFLHDAILKTICINWEERTLAISCIPNGYTSMRETIITFSNVKNVIVPFTDTWGPSFYINEALIEANRVSLEMQSGDVIIIETVEPCIEIREALES